MKYLGLNTIIIRINGEIDTLTSSKEKYVAMNTQLKTAITELTKAMSDMKTAHSKLTQCYSVDGQPRDEGRFQDIIDDISNKLTSLKTNILPSSNVKIDSINSSISSKRSSLDTYQANLNSKQSTLSAKINERKTWQNKLRLTM